MSIPAYLQDNHLYKRGQAIEIYTDPWRNSSIVAEDLNLASEDLLSLIPHLDPVLLGRDITLGEVNAVEMFWSVYVFKAF